MDDKFFSLHSPSILQNQVTEGPNFDNKTDEFDDDKGAFSDHVNTYQAENRPKFLRVGSDDNLMTSPSPKTLLTDKSLTDRVENGSPNFRSSLSKPGYNQRIQIIYEPMVQNLPNSQESIHNADMKRLGERQVSALNASIEQDPKLISPTEKKTLRSPSSRQPPLSLNPFLRPDNNDKSSTNLLPPNARSRKSWLKVKERIKDLKLYPKGSDPKVKMTHEKLYGGASSRVIDIIQDKAFVDNLRLKLLKKKTFRQTQPSKIVQILRKYTAKKQSTNEDRDNLFKVIDQLKVLKQGFPTRLKTKVENIFVHLGDFLKILRKQVYQLTVTPFKPLGPFKIIWNSFVLLFILYVMIYIPFWIAFENKLMDRRSAAGIIDTIQTIFFIIDIGISFHTAFYKDGTLVFDKQKIARNYLQGWFAVDIISSFPYEEVINLALNDTEEKSQSHQNAVQILNLLKLIRVLRIIKIKRVLLGLQDYLQNRPVIHGLISLLKLSFVIAFLAHWCACGWEYIATDSDGTDWIKLDSPDRYSIKDQYIGALYFSLTTMLTVGYGDIIPATTSQRVYLIFMMLLGGGVFGYIMSSIAIIVQSLEDEGSKIRRKISTLSYYLQKKGLSKDVQIEAKKYLDFVFEDQNRMNATETEMFNNLSQEIKNKILEQMNGKLLYENKVVVDNFSKKFLYFVSSLIEERRFIPGEHILDSSSTEYCLYYITKGAVNIYIPKVARPWYSLKSGDHFGETSFFVGQNDSLKAKGIEFSLVLCLSRGKFLKALEDFPLDREAFCAIKDSLLLYNKHHILQLKCPVCDELDHLLEFCPKLRYIPDKEKVIENYLKEVAITRKNFVRRYRLRFGPRRNLKVLEAVATDIAKEYSQEAEDIIAINPEREDEEEDKFEESEQLYKNEPAEVTLNRRSVNSSSTSHLNFLVKHRMWPMSVKDKFVREMYHTRKSKRHSIALSGLMGGLSREIESSRRKSAIFHHDDALAEFYGVNEEFQFDKLMNFQIYFPHNNPVKVIERLNIKDKRIRQEPNEIRRLKYHLKRFFKAIDKEKDPKPKVSSRILTQDGAETSKILEQQTNKTPPQGTAQDTSILQ